MKHNIKHLAAEIGIDVVGITNVLDYSYKKTILEERAKLNYNCEFEENNINIRLNVKNVFPQCKSIIAIAIPYAHGYKKINVADKGLLSVVSLGEDYHRKLREKLVIFAQKIKEYIDFDYRICVDTSPLIDREICKNASIGEYGKNSLLINDKYGSFINLGYLLTSIEVEDDDKIINTINSNSRHAQFCNNCNNCIKSCPNGAILEEGGINSKRCVSYLTQTRKYIPIEYRKNIKNQIYGCDICQLVCPKNKHILNMEQKEDFSKLMVELKELLYFSNADFKNKYGSLSGAYVGKNIWKRNALIAIANLNLIYLFLDVINELNNPSEMIKMYAAWALIELDNRKGKDILLEKIKYENANIREEYTKLMEEY